MSIRRLILCSLLLALSVGCRNQPAPQPEVPEEAAEQPQPPPVRKQEPPPRKLALEPAFTLVAEGGAQHIAFAPKRKLLAYSSSQLGVVVADLSEKKRRTRRLAHPIRNVLGLAFSHDESALVVCGEDSSAEGVAWWETGKWEAGKLPIEGQSVRGIQFTGDDELVAFGLSRKIQVWDWKKKSVLRTLPLPRSSLSERFDLGAKGDALAGLAWDRHSLQNTTLAVWAPRKSDAPVFSLKLELGKRQQPYTVALSPGGKEVVVGCLDGSVLRCDQKGSGVLFRGPSPIRLLRYFSDSLLLVVDFDGRVSVRDASAGREVAAASLPYSPEWAVYVDSARTLITQTRQDEVLRGYRIDPPKE